MSEIEQIPISKTDKKQGLKELALFVRYCIKYICRLNFYLILKLAKASECRFRQYHLGDWSVVGGHAILIAPLTCVILNRVFILYLKTISIDLINSKSKLSSANLSLLDNKISGDCGLAMLQINDLRTLYRSRE
jgi:hypothetical protein